MTERIIGDVQYGALANPMLNAVLKEFGPEAFRRCSVMMEFEHFLRRIAPPKGGKDGRRTCCLEIGTYNGISAIVLSQYFDRVVCVSVDERPGELLKHRIVKYLGIDNIRFFDCKDNDAKKAVVQQLDFDFCYMDGDHANDTYADWEMVRHCGKVLLHEVWPLQPKSWALAESLPKGELLRAQFDCLAFWQAGGIPNEMRLPVAPEGIA